MPSPLLDRMLRQAQALAFLQVRQFQGKKEDEDPDPIPEKEVLTLLISKGCRLATAQLTINEMIDPCGWIERDEDTASLKITDAGKHQLALFRQQGIRP